MCMCLLVSMCVNAYVQTTYYIHYIIILLPYVYMMHICAVMVHLLQFDKNADVWYNPCNICDNVYTETYMGVKCNMTTKHGTWKTSFVYTKTDGEKRGARVLEIVTYNHGQIRDANNEWHGKFQYHIEFVYDAPNARGGYIFVGNAHRRYHNVTCASRARLARVCKSRGRYTTGNPYPIWRRWVSR